MPKAVFYNVLIRLFFPKGTDFLNVAQDEVARVVELINDRPRKCLGWLSPREVFCCTSFDNLPTFRGDPCFVRGLFSTTR